MQENEARRHAPVRIDIEELGKSYGNFAALENVSLTVKPGELLALLGPSGSGKTTLLRAIAGLTATEEGSIRFDGEDATVLSLRDRRVGFVFQQYALFRHMTVFDNVAFGLRVRPRDERPRAGEIARRVRRLLDLVQLGGLEKRFPSQISGGQRQRVALARSLIKQPKLLLLDEPLGALDKKLREETQFELIRIQESLGVTFIVVTHDQDEAMTLATRIGVMNEGVIRQVGEPREIYEEPNSRFVADFIGSVNLFEGQVTEVGAVMRVDTGDLGEMQALGREGVSVGQQVWLALRPERVALSRAEPATRPNTNCLPGVVEEVGYMGHMSNLRVRLANGRMLRVTLSNRLRDEDPLTWDEAVFASWPASTMRVLTE